MYHQTQARLRRGNKRTSPLFFGVQLGFFAGLIWGGIRWFVYVFHFTSVIPGFIAEPFFKHNDLLTTSGQFIGWGAFILFSIVASIIYTLLLRKVPGPYMGLFYGLVWWGLLFVVLRPAFGVMPLVWKMTWNTISTELCMMLIWGLFIGYTVAVEFNNERVREPGGAEPSKPDENSLSPVKGGTK